MPKTTKLLDEIDKAQREYWESAEDCKKEYQAYLKQKSKYVGLASKEAKLKNKVLELIAEYKR